MTNAIVNDFNALAATFREYEAKKRADLAGTPVLDPDEPTRDSVSRHSNNDPIGDGGESVVAPHAIKGQKQRAAGLRKNQPDAIEWFIKNHPGAAVLQREKERVAAHARGKRPMNSQGDSPSYPTNRRTNDHGQTFEDRRIPLGPYAARNLNAMTHDMLQVEARPPHQWTVGEARAYGQFRKLKADVERGYQVQRVLVKT